MKRRVIDKRKKEKFVVDDAYLNGFAKLCGINATGVYVVLCRHCNKEQECFPSKRLIAEKLGISERSVYNGINNLKKCNIIKVRNQGRKKDGSFKNLTYILVDKSEWQANNAVGKLCRRQQVQSPQAPGAVSRRHHVPNKETHIEGNTYKETHTSKKSKKSKKSKDLEKNPVVVKYQPKSLELAKLLYELIKINTPDWHVEPDWDKWADGIDKINRIDGRNWEQIEWMIRWTQDDDFWKQNILSPEKLRKQFNTLVVRVRAKYKNQSDKVAIYDSSNN